MIDPRDIQVRIAHIPSPRELLLLIRDLQERVLILEAGALPTSDPSVVKAGPHAPRSVTSRKAALHNAPRTGTQRQKILQHIIDQGDQGATRQETAIELGMSDDSVRPRVVELIDGGWVQVSNFTRPTPLGEQAEVLIATVYARRELSLRTEQVRASVSPGPVVSDGSVRAPLGPGRASDAGVDTPVAGPSETPGLFDPPGREPLRYGQEEDLDAA